MCTFCALLLSVYSNTCLPIFIEIGLYLADTVHKIGWHSFLRHGVHLLCIVYATKSHKWLTELCDCLHQPQVLILCVNWTNCNVANEWTNKRFKLYADALKPACRVCHFCGIAHLTIWSSEWLWFVTYRVSQKITLGFFIDFSEMAWNFNIKFYTFILRFHLRL